jgi:hypothetical protein
MTLRVYLINGMLIVAYNAMGWAYILFDPTMRGSGGGLGPGLTLIFITGAHLVALLTYAIVQSTKRKDKLI